MRVLDVGCGSGSLLRSVYDANGNATGVGLDVDETVVREARNNISAWGLAEQFDIRHGDILSFSGENLGPFDLITLVNILYYFNKEERAGLINKLRTMQSPKGMLAVAMMFHSKGRDIAAANLNMVNCSMKGLTPLPVLDDITSLLKQCGYGRISIHRFMPGSTFYGIVAYNS